MTAIVRGATAQLTARPSGTVTAWKTWLSPTFKVPAGDRMDSDVMGASAPAVRSRSSGALTSCLRRSIADSRARVQAPFSTV